MATWRKVVLSVLLAQAVICEPLVNQLASGAKWPERNSVKQPTDTETADVTPKTESEITEVPQLPSKDVTETVPELPEPAIDYSETSDTESALDEDGDKNENFSFKALIPKDYSQRVDYSGAQVWEISLQKPGNRAIVNRLVRRNLISPWGGNQSFVDVMVKPSALPNVTNIITREKIPYEILIDDLQERINGENPPLVLADMPIDALDDRQAKARAYNFWRYRASHRRKLVLVGANMGYNTINIPKEYRPHANWGHRMTWKRYHSIGDIYGFMEYLAKTYPAFVSVQNIGKTYLGRDIKALRISDGKITNKRVFIDGGIHAREWISPATVTFFINQFAENFDDESEDVRNIDWYFVPVINADGYEHTRTGDRLWRKNMRPVGAARRCLGADLNRNWGHQWGGKGSSNNPCSDIYRGNRAFSEPESKAVSEYIKANGPFSGYLSYHSYGQYILYPWGYDDVLPPDHEDMHSMGMKMAQIIEQTGGSRYSVGSSSGLLYPAAGGSDDWAKAQGIKYSYTVELSDTGRYGFILPASYIIPVATESLAGLRVLAATVNRG